MGETTKYIRDKRSPIPTSIITSKVMSANKHKNTKPEILFRKGLSQMKIRGYRLNSKKVIGRPDISFSIPKIAIFIHGCFWHRCPKCNLPLPKSNTNFWIDKFNKNIQRDAAVVNELKNNDWTVFVFWECEINQTLETCISVVKSSLPNYR